MPRPRSAVILCAWLAIGTVPVASPITMASAQTARRLERLATDSAVREYLTSLQRLPSRRRFVADSLDAVRRESCRQALPTVTTVTGGTSASIARNEPATVVGTVTSSMGPLFGAQVRVASLDLTTGSGEDGRFALVVPARAIAGRPRLAIVARSFGFALGTAEVALAPGDSVEVAFTLCADDRRLAFGIEGGRDGEAPRGGPPRIERDPPLPLPRTSPVRSDSASTDRVSHIGDVLVVLRRGRLFTISVAKGDIRPVAAIDAFAPGVEPDGAMYDELLVLGERVVVLGHSATRGGTELNVFRVSRSGDIDFESSHLLFAEDHHSSRGVAAWTSGSALVLYSSLPLGHFDSPGVMALRRWNARSVLRGYEPVSLPVRVFRSAAPARFVEDASLHALTTCRLAGSALSCASDVFVGPPGSVVHRARRATYIWAAAGSSGALAEAEPATLIRVPHDGGTPAAVGVAGSPVDRESMREEANGDLLALVEREGDGDRGTNAESVVKELALLRVPSRAWGDGRTTIDASAYRPVPWPYAGALQARFAGETVVYGTTGLRRETMRPNRFSIFVVPLGDGKSTELYTPYPTQRIEAFDGQVLVAGVQGATLLTELASNGTPVVRTRSQHLVAAVEIKSSALGRLSRFPGADIFAIAHVTPTAMTFMQPTADGLVVVGQVGASRQDEAVDRCRTSCTTERSPILVQVDSRSFVQIGFDLIEVAPRDGRISELRRVDFMRP